MKNIKTEQLHKFQLKLKQKNTTTSISDNKNEANTIMNVDVSSSLLSASSKQHKIDDKNSKNFIFNEKVTNDDSKTPKRICLELVLSSSTSSLIENDDIIFDDSLQDNSFDSDR